MLKNDKMDGFINSSIEKQTIYEIYRACRLCGAGAGYKMPIMQNVVHLDVAEIELRQKIRDCVQIEVHQEDKMPPLICELCVDKVNDFYEFLEMCRQTNKRTRLRLGLPPQTMPRGMSDAGDCILGVTEPVYLNEDSNESLLKPRPKSRNKGRFTKDSKNTNKTNPKENEVRSLRSKHISPPPQRASKRTREEDMSLSKLQLQKTRRSATMPKSILRKESEIKVEEEWSPTRSKRSRDTRDTKPETVKRVKIVEKRTPKSDFKCKTCKSQFTNVKSLNNHMRTHSRPQPKYKSTPKPEKKNNCSKCKKDFPTKVSLDRHKCPKISGNKCGTCGRYISNLRNLANHERACQNKKEFIISPHLLKQLRPIQIRVKRCDPLLKKVGERYDVSAVDCNFGLDKNCIYPYLTSLRIKTEPSYMVNIHDTIDEFDLNQDYVHWDSDSLESDLEISDLREKGVGTLANLSLRTIFSHKFLGKVPKRKRRVRADKDYDSILNFDSNARIGIDSITDGLDKDRSVNDTKDNDNDSLFGDNKKPVSNDDFDSLFCSNNDSENSLNDNKSNPGDEKCEIVHKNNEIENKNSDKLEKINEINNDNLAELPCKDTIKNTQENEFSEVVPDNASMSEVNNDVVMSNEQDSIIKDTEHKEDDGLISNKTIKDSKGKENEESAIKNTQENEFSEVVPDNASISEVNNDVVMSNEQDSIIKDTGHKEDDGLISNKTIKDSKGKENEESILKNKDNIDNDKVEQNDNEASNYINNKETELTENVIENDDSALGNETEKITNKINDNDLESNIPVIEKDVSIDISTKELSGVNNAENNDSSPHEDDNKINDDDNKINDDDNKINDDASLNKTVANNDNKLDETAFHVNGDDKLDLDDLEDISDSEMDDNRLMDAIDEQIGEKENESKSQENEKVSVSVEKSADLDSISSEELPNE